MLYLESEAPKEGDSPFRPSYIRKLIEYYDDEEKIEDLYSYLDLWSNKTEIVHYMNEIFSILRKDDRVRLFDGKTDIFSSIVNGENVSLTNKILLYSIMYRLYIYGKDADLCAMRDYVRIIRNFLLNTRAFVRKKCSFSPDLRYGRNAGPILQNLVFELVDSDNPYETFIKTKFSDINSEIYNNELAKAKLIVENDELKSMIHSLEDLDIFKSTLTNIIPYVEKTESRDLASWIEKIFVRENSVNVVRAFLSIGDYGIPIGNSFWGDRIYYGHYNNWYSILTYQGNEKYKRIICDFLFQFEKCSAPVLKDRFKEIIDKNLESIDFRDWRYCLIKYERVLKNNSSFVSSEILILTADEHCGIRVNRRPNGIIMMGYHVILEYIEIYLESKNIDYDCLLGYAAEKDCSLRIAGCRQTFLKLNRKGDYEIICSERDREWADRIRPYEFTSKYDRVVAALKLIEIIKSEYKKYHYD